MRVGLIIADGKVILGPVPASEAESAFKAAVLSGGNGAQVLDLWTEDRGRERRQKFDVKPAPVAEKPRKK